MQSWAEIACKQQKTRENRSNRHKMNVFSELGTVFASLVRQLALRASALKAIDLPGKGIVKRNNAANEWEVTSLY